MRIAFTVLYGSVAVVALVGGAIAGHALAGVAMAALVILLSVSLAPSKRPNLLTAGYLATAGLWVAAAVLDEPVFFAMAAFCLIKAWANRAGVAPGTSA